MCKRCSKCGENKAVSQFNKSKDNRDGFTTWCKSCVKEAGRKSYLKDTRRQLLRSAKQNAKARGIAFAIELHDLPSLPVVCPVLGIPLEVGLVRRSDNSPSLDRIDNAIGYQPGNVAIVSWRANRLKGSATVEELQLIASFYGRNRNE